MSSLMRWDPFRDGLSLRNAMDRLFEDSFVTPRLGWIAPVGAIGLALDMYETKDEVTIKAALPGIKPEQAEVTITGNTLTIRGESQEEKESTAENYLCKERHFGSFARTVTLPAGLKADKAEATFEDGVLTLKIPKTEEAKPKTIKVKAK
ncbi:MAG: Hsp20/alpha crystallin family protein [Chloroflexi bacterium]|nr:Hsp20/alpha crystallin family protein [Chloroflexota bacterium]